MFQDFDGTDPLGWIFKASLIFYFHHTPNNQRITISSFYMDGSVLIWFQWMYRITSWDELVRSVEIRFAPFQYEDLEGSLFKLSQTLR